LHALSAPPLALHSKDGKFDIPALTKRAADWAGLVGLDLAKEVHTEDSYEWTETRWIWPDGFGANDGLKRVVLIDYGVKRNIMRLLASLKLGVTVVPATMKAADILKLDPDGIVLSNGPGDPAATGEYAIAVIQDLVESGLPLPLARKRKKWNRATTARTILLWITQRKKLKSYP